MKKNRFRLMPLLLLGLWLGSGCVPPLYYKDMIAPMNYEGSGGVALAVHDQREYIKSGKTEASYEGQVRATVGIPYHRNTVTGGPLATEMARGLSATLLARGFQPAVVGVAAADPAADVIGRLKGTGAPKLLLLTIEEWMYDGWGTYTLEGRLTLKVLSASGSVLATATDEMKENLGSHPMGPAKEAYRRRLERLLNNPEVAKVLGAAPPAAPEPKPTEPTPTEPASGSAGEPPPVPAEDKPNAGEPPPVPAEDKAKGTTPAPPAEG